MKSPVYVQVEKDLAGICERLLDSGNVFRGCSNYEYELMPAVGRLPEYDIEIESRLISQFISHSGLNRDIAIWEKIVLAQHFGVPTRLLDWTTDPAVALFFAARNIRSTDFCVYLTTHKILTEYPEESPLEILKPVFVRPRTLEARMKNQKAVFSVHQNPQEPIPLKIVSQYIIKSDLRPLILAICKELGIDDSHIFPLGSFELYP